MAEEMMILIDGSDPGKADEGLRVAAHCVIPADADPRLLQQRLNDALAAFYKLAPRGKVEGFIVTSEKPKVPNFNPQ